MPHEIELERYEFPKREDIELRLIDIDLSPDLRQHLICNLGNLDGEKVLVGSVPYIVSGILYDYLISGDEKEYKRKYKHEKLIKIKNKLVDDLFPAEDTKIAEALKNYLIEVHPSFYHWLDKRGE